MRTHHRRKTNVVPMQRNRRSDQGPAFYAASSRPDPRQGPFPPPRTPEQQRRDAIQSAMVWGLIILAELLLWGALAIVVIKGT